MKIDSGTSEAALPFMRQYMNPNPDPNPKSISSDKGRPWKW
jgi:hypothetical protein